jgi:hypothetical protein
MRITFPRLPAHERAYAVIERDDGVVYRLYGGEAGSSLPHEVRHLIVERSLGIRDGLWGKIACGRPPSRAAEQSLELRHHQFRQHATRAEMLEDVAERVAGLDAPTTAEIRRLAAAVLTALPGGGTDVDPEAIAAAARALQVEASRWARLRPGQELVYEWPPVPRPRLPRT